MRSERVRAIYDELDPNLSADNRIRQGGRIFVGHRTPT